MCKLPFPALDLRVGIGGRRRAAASCRFFLNDPAGAVSTVRLQLGAGCDGRAAARACRPISTAGTTSCPSRRARARLLVTVRRSIALPPFAIRPEQYAGFAAFCSQGWTRPSGASCASRSARPRPRRCRPAPARARRPASRPSTLIPRRPPRDSTPLSSRARPCSTPFSSAARPSRPRGGRHEPAPGLPRQRHRSVWRARLHVLVPRQGHVRHVRRRAWTRPSARERAAAPRGEVARQAPRPCNADCASRARPR